MQGDVAALKSRLREHPDEISYNNGLIGFYATPLHLAAEKNDTNMMAFLLDSGAAIDDTNGYRTYCTPLHCAAARGNLAALAFLLLRGANVNSLDSEDETPLHYAASTGHVEALTYLIAHGAHLNARSKIYYRTPLENAVLDKRVQAARTLLERGAEANFDKLIASIQSEMDGAPLAPQARRDEWLNTISVLREFKEERRAH